MDPVISSLMTYLISEKNYNHGTEYKCNDLELYFGITKNIHFVLTEITVGDTNRKKYRKEMKVLYDKSVIDMILFSPTHTNTLTYGVDDCIRKSSPHMILMIVFENLRPT